MAEPQTGMLIHKLHWFVVLQPALWPLSLSPFKQGLQKAPSKNPGRLCSHVLNSLLPASQLVWTVVSSSFKVGCWTEVLPHQAVLSDCRLQKGLQKTAWNSSGSAPPPAVFGAGGNKKEMLKGIWSLFKPTFSATTPNDSETVWRFVIVNL